MADQQRDVIEVLEQDHREVEQMFAELESLRGASTEEAQTRRKELTEPQAGRACRGVQEGGADAAAPARAQRTASADGGGPGGLAL